MQVLSMGFGYDVTLISQGYGWVGGITDAVTGLGSPLAYYAF